MTANIFNQALVTHLRQIKVAKKQTMQTKLADVTCDSINIIYIIYIRNNFILFLYKPVSCGDFTTTIFRRI